MNTPIRRKLLKWMCSALALAAVLLYLFGYVYYRPGGLADWRMSRDLELEATIRIPLGATPGEAVERFRNHAYMEVIQEEPVKGGVLVFYKHSADPEINELQVEYVRKTWFGWKWVWGGGYGIGKSRDSASARIALNYMGIPKRNTLSRPFPLWFGEVLGPAVERIAIRSKGTDSYTAKLAEGKGGHRIWYVSLPAADPGPYRISGYNQEGDEIAFHDINDGNDCGTISMKSN